jgi:hypothetical protein
VERPLIGLRPELQALFDRLAIDPHTELFVRSDGMVLSGPDPVSEISSTVPADSKRVACFEIDLSTTFHRAAKILARSESGTEQTIGIVRF